MRLLRNAIVSLAGLLSLQQASATPTPAVEERQTATIANSVIFSPPSNAGWVDPRVLYARAVQLQSGALLATWENYSPEPPRVYFPIYRSTDGGASWAQIGQVDDTVNGWGLRYQPFLYQLPIAIGAYPAGTLLVAGNSIPTDLSLTKIDIYASKDEGVTWSFVSSVASGGVAQPVNGETPVWEPLLMVYDNQLVCYYSDQRDSKYGQKLVHQTTTDLKTWSAIVDDVHDTNSYAARPGMPAITKLPDNNYIFAYEACGTDGCRVHYRLSSDPLAVLSAPSYTMRSTAGSTTTSSPFVVWSSVGGGVNGTIVLSGGSASHIFVNQRLGDPDAWVEHATPQPNAYARSMVLFRDDDAKMLIIGAGRLPPSTTNYVSVSVVDLKVTMGL
ncbi:putative glycoside hydrolase family 93 [Rosellinia necatrix]|uniref:Putative glycoside hydrolase family 93 n=1 Tax=Rosellinia necatrix TaxID=77044 RepID=A0A1W2TPS5_ROSNE|nr:putative glycoside hydrolase family 93 [Rosellinia necatrix]